MIGRYSRGRHLRGGDPALRADGKPVQHSTWALGAAAYCARRFVVAFRQSARRWGPGSIGWDGTGPGGRRWRPFLFWGRAAGCGKTHLGRIWGGGGGRGRELIAVPRSEAKGVADLVRDLAAPPPPAIVNTKTQTVRRSGSFPLTS